MSREGAQRMPKPRNISIHYVLILVFFKPYIYILHPWVCDIFHNKKFLIRKEYKTGGGLKKSQYQKGEEQGRGNDRDRAQELQSAYTHTNKIQAGSLRGWDMVWSLFSLTCPQPISCQHWCLKNSAHHLPSQSSVCSGQAFLPTPPWCSGFNSVSFPSSVITFPLTLLACFLSPPPSRDTIWGLLLCHASSPAWNPFNYGCLLWLGQHSTTPVQHPNIGTLNNI